MEYRQKVYWLILLSAILKIGLAAQTGLGNVEAYYWVLSTRLEWNYFDHPPMVAWLIRLFTLNGLLHAAVFIRLGAIVCSSFCVWLMYMLAKQLHSERAGWYAALLYTGSVYATLGVGTNILPDSPEMVFWLLGLILLLRISQMAVDDPKYSLTWCLFGLVSGCCIMSKMHGIFIWAGAAGFFLSTDRKHLRHPGIYLALLVTLICTCPILIWNIRHHFVTLQFQGERMIPNRGTGLLRFLKELFAVIFTMGPINFALILINLAGLVRKKRYVLQKEQTLIFWCSLPLIILLLIVSLFRETYPHWPGPAYTTLLVLPAIQLAETRNAAIGSRFPRVLLWSAGYVMIIGLLQIVVINWMPGIISPRQQDGMKLGEGDLTLDMHGWPALRDSLRNEFREDSARHLMPAGAPLIACTWSTAARLDDEVGYYTGKEVIALGNVMTIHHYYWLNQSKHPLNAGAAAYYIIPSNLFTYKELDQVSAQFENVQLARTVPVYRSGVLVRMLYVYHLRGYLPSPVKTSFSSFQ